MASALYNHFFPSETIYEKIAGVRKTDSYLGVIAIDFGSTFSGYAFSFKDEYDRDVMRFHTNNWQSGTQLSSVKAMEPVLQTSYDHFLPKSNFKVAFPAATQCLILPCIISVELSCRDDFKECPSSILFSPDKSFHSFGYEAENHFTNLCADNAEQDYFFYRNFKMFLHYERNLTRDSVIFDVNRSHRTMKAMIVFSESIRYLSTMAMNHVQKMRPQIAEVDIKWVVTIPAIWSDRAKLFMREASETAGIPHESLLFAIEPEAASLYCQAEQENSPYSSIGYSTYDVFSSGSTYLLVDAGGGTVDCTVHEIQDDRKVKELFSYKGGACGGTKVDKAFKDFLEEQIGQNILNELCKEHPDDFFEIMRNFEIAKRTPLSQTSTVHVKLPMSLFTIYTRLTKRSLQDDVNNTSLSDRFFVRRDKFLFPRTSFNEFFHGPVSEILQILKEILNNEKCRNVKHILLVGGFSDSEILLQAITNEFKDKNVVSPENKESGNAVMKGAVLYGHKPNIITQRRARCTYGVRAFVDFIEGQDPPEYKEIVNGQILCKNYFDILVRKGDALKVNESQVERRYERSNAAQTIIMLHLYASPEENPRYIYHTGCTYIGKITIPLNERCRELILRLYFGDTEFHCTVQQGDGEELECESFDFLAD